MKIRQSVAFVVQSESVTGDEVQRKLAIEGAAIWVAGSETVEPRRPRFHTWRITCDQPGLRLDEQIKRIVERLRPARLALEGLSRDPEIEMALSVFREFDAGSGAEDDAQEKRGKLVRLGGQHQLLGWHLPSEIVQFFAALNCSLDFDEYG